MSLRDQCRGSHSALAVRGVTFYFNRMSLNNNNDIFWVSYNGPRKDCQKYKFTIEVLDKQGQASILCTKFCIPCDTSRDVVKEEFLGVTANKKMAKENNRVEDKVQFFSAR